VTGFDQVLNGGLPKDHCFLIEGEPGTGKTTLGMQFLLEGVRCGEKVLYVSLSETEREIRKIARSHGWVLDGMSLYEWSHPEQTLHPEEQYTVFHPADVEFHDATQSILKEVERVQPTRVVFDSLSEIRLLANDPLLYRRQILALKHYFTTRNATVLLLDDRRSTSNEVDLQTIAHGVITFETVPRDYGKVHRRMRVSKLRGSTYREGNHDYTIKSGGIVISPRLTASEHNSQFIDGIVSSGSKSIDTLWGGGIDRGTATLLVGPAGCAKSTVALSYAVAAGRRGETAVLYLFEELLPSILRRGAALGIDPKPLVDSRKLFLKKIDPAEMNTAEFVVDVRRAVEQLGATTVIIDSVNGLLQAMPNEGNLMIQLHEMLAFLNKRGLVTLLVLAQTGIVGMSAESPVDMSYLADNILLFRFFEAEGRVRKAISVVKRRGGAHEDTIRELTLAEGIIVGAPLSDFRGVLTGVPVYTGDGNKLENKQSSTE